MPKLKPEDLEKIRKQMEKSMSLRNGEGKVKVTVHMGTCGIASGARKIVNVLMKLIGEEGDKGVILTTSACAGLCSREPMATVELKGEAPVKYVDLTEEKIEKIYIEHVMKGNIVKEFALAKGSEQTS